MACTFSQDEVEVRPFLASAKPSKIVFQGKVHKIEYLGKNAKGNPTQKITFKVSRWWRGMQREFVTVHGETGVMAQFDCEGAYDFRVKPGSEWIALSTSRS